MSKLLELLISKKNSLEKKIIKYSIKNKSSFEDFELLSLQFELSETITKIEQLKKSKNIKTSLIGKIGFWKNQLLKTPKPLKPFYFIF